MKIEEIKVGDFVEDSWWPLDVFGKIVRKTSASVYLFVEGGIRRYDAAHCRFLRLRRRAKK